MEADISIWQKPGHFYFALTDRNGRGQGFESQRLVNALIVHVEWNFKFPITTYQDLSKSAAEVSL